MTSLETVFLWDEALPRPLLCSYNESELLPIFIGWVILWIRYLYIDIDLTY